MTNLDLIPIVLDIPIVQVALFGLAVAIFCLGAIMGIECNKER